MGDNNMNTEEHERVYQDALVAFRAGRRAWMAAQQPPPVTMDDLNALERRYNIEHSDELTSVETLAAAVAVANAELSRRWVEAHEDLAVLRRAGILQTQPR